MLRTWPVVKNVDKPYTGITDKTKIQSIFFLSKKNFYIVDTSWFVF